LGNTTRRSVKGREVVVTLTQNERASSPPSLRHRRLLSFPGAVACELRAQLWQFCFGQSVLNAAAHLMYFYYVVTTMPRTHYSALAVYQSVLTSRSLSWSSACCRVSRHLNQLVHVADLPGCRRLRSSSSLQLLCHHSG